MSSACPACGAPVADVESVCPACGTDPRGAPGAAATTPPPAAPPAPGGVQAPGVHLTPDIGLKVFVEPYPAFGVNAGTFLPGREVVQVVAMRGTWVQVMHNGAVAGWVDGRGLVPPIGGVTNYPTPSTTVKHQWTAAPAAATEAQGVMVTLESIVGALGALSIIVGALIDWASSIVSITSFKVPVEFLFDPKTTSRDPKLGLFLLAFGLVGALASFFPGGRRWRVLFGLLALAAAITYCMQIAANIPDGSSISFTDIIGAGPWVTGIGGIVLMLSPLMKPRFSSEL